MNQLVELIPFIPSKFQNFVSYLILVYVILFLIWKISKVLQTKEMKWISTVAERFRKILSVAIKKGLQLPTRYPFLELVGEVYITIFSYFMVLYSSAIFVLISVLTIITDDMSALKRLLALSVAAIFLLLARFFFAEGKRGRLSVPVLWRNFRKRRK